MRQTIKEMINAIQPGSEKPLLPISVSLAVVAFEFEDSLLKVSVVGVKAFEALSIILLFHLHDRQSLKLSFDVGELFRGVLLEGRHFLDRTVHLLHDLAVRY